MSWGIWKKELKKLKLKKLKIKKKRSNLKESNFYYFYFHEFQPDLITPRQAWMNFCITAQTMLFIALLHECILYEKDVLWAAKRCTVAALPPPPPELQLRVSPFHGTHSPPHHSQLVWWGYSPCTRQWSSTRHMLTYQLACPPVASCRINQLLLHRGTPPSFQIPIFTKLVRAHGVSGTCTFLLVLANADNYLKLSMSKVQALTACSAEEHLLLFIKQTRKWAFTGAGKALLQALYQHCLPPGELETHNKHTHGYIWFSVTVTGMSRKATTRRQALANELLKQSCFCDQLNVIKSSFDFEK